MSSSTPSAAPLQVPYPEDSAQVQLLLKRYSGLYHGLANPFNNDNSQANAELNAIEKLLHNISNDQDTYNAQLDKVSELVQASQQSNTNKYDIELLKKQIIGFNLLAKDLDLPNSLQIEFGSNSVYADNGEKSTDKQDSKSNPEDVNELKPIQVDLSNFEQRYENFVPIDSPSLSKNADNYHDVVGNKYAELKISNKISERITQLESLPANLANVNTKSLLQNFNKSSEQKFDDGIDQLKTNSLVELKSLKLLTKQKQLRQHLLSAVANQSHDVDSNLKDSSTIVLARRLMNMRLKIIAPQTARLAEQLEEQQKRELKNIEYKKKLKALSKRLESINDLLFAQSEVKNTRNIHFFKSVTNFHQQAEKEAAKRLERTAKERLQALKSNDEEAYLKLLDQTKDTRITHLLKQTNSFLDSLAKAVKVQQDETKQQLNVSAAADASAAETNEGLDDEERENMDYYHIAHNVKEKVTKQPNLLVGGTLKEYQIKGLEWMVSLYNNHLNGILADEMGLGKTIQSISLVTYLIEVKKERGPFLIIVPLSTITNWTLECERWAPAVKKIVYKGTPNQRKLLAHEVRRGDFQILLTTYEYIIKDRSLLSKLKWAHMIIDEGHRMKNTNSKLSFTLTNYYYTKNRLILTGTPLQNNLPELWALLNFVLPKIFNSVKTFDEWFNTPFANAGTGEKLELSEEESLLIIRRLHKVLRPFLLRRLKKDVEKDLPDKVEKVVKCKFSGLQYALYQQMLRHNALFVGSSINNGTTKSGIKGLNNKIMQLRKVCNHPFVFEEVEDLINPSRLSNATLWRTSGKFELLDRVLPKFKASGHRVLIFFQMTSVMDIMEDYLRYRNMQFLRLDGGTKADERQDMLKEFNKKESEIFVFLLSTRAGGLGLNLQTADTVIIFDTDWNPHQDLQAQDRAHRIGQKNEVRILRLITSDSVEEVILERAHEKLNIDGKVIQAGKFDNKSTAEEQEAFLRRLLEAEELKKKGGAEEEAVYYDDDELNQILARSEEEKTLFHEMDLKRAADAKKDGESPYRLMTKEELPDVFSEETVDKQFNKKEVEAELGKTRERKKVMYDDGLTEEQWLEAMDNDDMTVEEAIAKKQEAMAKRRAKKAKFKTPDADEQGEDGDEDYDEEAKNEENVKPAKKRNRKSTAKKMNYNIDGDDGESAAASDNDEEAEAEAEAQFTGDEDEEEIKPKKKQKKAKNGAANGSNGAGKNGRSEEDVSKQTKGKNTANNNSSSNTTTEFAVKAQSLLDGLVELKDEETGDSVSELFLKLPSKKLYPDYYKIIKKPISVNEIQKKLNRKSGYKSYDDLVDDLKLMISNAQTYNEPGSFVYENATTIEQFINEFN